jgi:hypothetical protein
MWPGHDLNYRKYFNDEYKAVAAKYRTNEEFRDLRRQPWDHDLTWPMLVTLLLKGIPCACDFNWWSHSVVAVGLVIVDGEICLRCRNSWGNRYGDFGFFTIKGRKKYPDGAVAIVNSMAA